VSIYALIVRKQCRSQHEAGTEHQETAMTKIVVTEFVSLDGCIDEPRWTFQFDRGPEGDKFKWEELFDCDALLLGRLTYQGFAQAWPNMGGDEFGQRMNNIPKYVVSGTLADADATWGDTTIIRGDVPAEIAKLKAELGGSLLVEGSGSLVRELARHGLVDEYRLMIFPIILGGTMRMFPDGLSEPTTLKVTSSKALDSGILLLTYEPKDS
jgi:dihydrofolate reductase